MPVLVTRPRSSNEYFLKSHGSDPLTSHHHPHQTRCNSRPPTQDGLDDSGASGPVSLKRPALTPPDQDHPASRHHWLTVPRRHPTSRATAAADSPATTRATAS